MNRRGFFGAIAGAIAGSRAAAATDWIGYRCAIGRGWLRPHRSNNRILSNEEFSKLFREHMRRSRLRLELEFHSGVKVGDTIAVRRPRKFSEAAADRDFLRGDRWDIPGPG